jgi:hypothetical protein
MSTRTTVVAMTTLGILVLAVSALAQDFSGTYVFESLDGSLTLTLEQAGSGSVEGELTGVGLQLDIVGSRDGSGVSGTARTVTGETYGLVAVLDGELLQLQMFPFDDAGNPVYAYAETLILTRRQGAAGTGDPADAPTSKGPGPDATGGVSINRVKLDSEQVQKLERQYSTRIPEGRYWYDARCGAWGVEGGPTQGFILANLELPGPMPADVSGGGTGIFFNGREIHVQDQLALQQVFGFTIPGRYWLDAVGNLGVEGSAVPIANLAAAVQAARGGQYGSATGVGGTAASDGQGGTMFSGRTPSGKSVFWYSGQ